VASMGVSENRGAGYGGPAALIPISRHLGDAVTDDDGSGDLVVDRLPIRVPVDLKESQSPGRNAGRVSTGALEGVPPRDRLTIEAHDADAHSAFARGLALHPGHEDSEIKRPPAKAEAQRIDSAGEPSDEAASLYGHVQVGASVLEIGPSVKEITLGSHQTLLELPDSVSGHFDGFRQPQFGWEVLRLVHPDCIVCRR